jgi:signal transduction histidine kinase
MRTLGRLRRPLPRLIALIATLCAAALVLYYQYRALAALQSQTQVIFRQLGEQTATDVVAEVRRTLDGPVTDTLLAVTHSDLRDGRMDLVAEAYRNGLHNYPQVQSYFVWSKDTERIAPAEALFYGRESIDERDTPQMSDGARFRRDPALGREIIEIARRRQHAQHIYVAEEIGPDRLQVFLRLYWTDARRLAYYAVLGYVVAPSTLPDMFAALHERRLGALLRERGGDHPLELRVTDEQGRIVFGRLTKEPSASVPVSMEFYPTARIEKRLVAGGLTPRLWRFEVSANVPDRGLLQAYWPTAASVLLMLVGFGLIVQANRRADELARMQADFIGYASHQLKTPLSLISAAIETVEMAHVRSPEKLSQYIGIMRGEATRLSSLVQRILEFSRLQQSRSYEFEPVDLGALVRETVEAFASSLGAQQFTFVVEQEGASPHIVADPAAIEQVLANLLDNAVKYSGGSRDVRVRLWTTGGDAAIDVIDRGPGLTARDRARIFDKFYRGSAASRDRKGFGLGLPIIQELVKAHRGRVVVESTPGAGSVFRVILPATRSDWTDPPSMPVDEPTHGREVAHES